MGDPRQTPLSFNEFTFTDATDDSEITQVKAWATQVGDPPPDPESPSLQLTELPNGNGWGWQPYDPPDPTPPTDIVCVYFMFQVPNGWSTMLNVALTEGITAAFIEASSGASAGEYNIGTMLVTSETVTVPPPS